MNCFQKLLSSWWRTTDMKVNCCNNWLWIAFKNYYLRDEGQRSFSMTVRKVSCELLSKIIIFVMKDNFNQTGIAPFLVVNCFQKLLSSWWRTTFTYSNWINKQLWIAFKNYYLRDEGQRGIDATQRASCCELLSKIIIFVMKDNNSNYFPILAVVVNCFQKLLSSWWRTTVS